MRKRNQEPVEDDIRTAACRAVYRDGISAMLQGGFRPARSPGRDRSAASYFAAGLLLADTAKRCSSFCASAPTPRSTVSQYVE